MSAVCANEYHERDYEYYSLLVNGYTRLLENEYKMLNAINDAMQIILWYILPRKLLGFDLYHPKDFKISQDKLTINGTAHSNNRDDHCLSTHLIYAESYYAGVYNNLHFWSIECIDLPSISSLWFALMVGIKNERNKLWIYEKWPTPHEGGLFYHLKEKIAKQNWRSHTITLKLDRNDWTLTYYKGTKQIQKDNIKPNERYYFVLQVPYFTRSEYKVVPTPQCLLP